MKFLCLEFGGSEVCLPDSAPATKLCRRFAHCVCRMPHDPYYNFELVYRFKVGSFILRPCIVCVRDSDNGERGLTSSSNASCKPRWIVYPNTYYKGHSKEYKNLRSLRECLVECAADERCLNVIWDRLSGACYRYYEDSKRSNDPLSDWFEIVRDCFKASGT